MIQFFRRIRKRLLGENRVRKYLLYAIGEIALVVIGILIALQVNNWNEIRKAGLIEVELLKGLEMEMEDNRDQLIQVIEAHSKNIGAAEKLLTFFGQDMSQSSETDFDSLFTDLMLTWTYDPRVGKINSIIASGQLNYIHNEELKAQITSFEDEARDVSELNLKFLSKKYSRLDPLIDKLISRKNRFDDMIKDEVIPKSAFKSDYQSVFNSFEIENIISSMWALSKFGLIEEKEHLVSLESTIDMIKAELGK
jgi:hypothetical protein